MTSVSQARYRRMYSWWWDSHISPKNSKWLQENLTDMDSKVKQMIKVIEEDADSFARRAEMYYKKRPELMKLVEEFYRAYRALAERYDHATGVIRQAHRTMAEAFPNQAPFMLSDEPPGTVPEGDPHTPEMPHPGRAMFDPDELQKEALGLSSSQFHSAKRNGGFSDDPELVTGRKGLKQYNDVFGSVEKFADGRARKGLNFRATEEEERDRGPQRNGSRNLQAQALSDSDRMGKAEAEISNLKTALAKLESEKEAGLLKYEQSLERLSNLESEVSRAQNDSADLNERASKAEAEVRNLKEALAKLQAERDESLLQYQKYLEQISNLENKASSAQKNAEELDERVRNAESEAEALKRDKDSALEQYKQSLEMISNLQGKLVQAEEDTRQINERSDKAEREFETLKQELAKLTEEKEAAVVRYLQCLETISNLESKLARAQEEAERLNSEINVGVAKLKGAEERCLALENSNLALQSELESLVHKVGSQGEELTEKQKELGRLWTCIQEERMRFVEAETAFQTLQHMHSQSQEELRSLVSELQNKAEILNDIQTRNRGLENEVQKVMEEKKSLNELNLSSAVSIKNLQDDILSLRATIKRLEEEVELRVDQRNALQQEIYCLREELNELSKKHRTMLEQVESVGYDPECFGSSVKDLQDDNSNLKQSCEASRIERVALLEQLKIMEKLMEKNAVLENSIADLNDELDAVRERVKALEESFCSLLEEKSNLVAEKTSLISQLQVTNENLETLSEKHSILENSLFDANAELEGLRIKSKSLEDSCLVLDGENYGLKTERDSLVSQLDHTQNRLEDLGNRYAVLEEKLCSLEKDRENALTIVDQLRVQSDAEKNQHANFCQLSEARLASKELQICRLKEEGLCRKKEYEDEEDKALNGQIEILILLKFIQGLEVKHLALLAEQQKLLEESDKSKELISEIQHESIGQKVENQSLSKHNNVLRSGIYQLMKILNIAESTCCADEAEQDRRLLAHLIVKLQETQDSLFATLDENHRLVTEKSVLVATLEQLESDGTNLMTERDTIDREHKIKSEKDRRLLAHLIVKLQETQDSLFATLDENHRLVTEKSVLVAILEQLESDGTNLMTERDTIDREHKIKSEKLFALQVVSRELCQNNEESKLKIAEGDQREKALASKTEDLLRQLVNLQSAHEILQKDNIKLREENKSLMVTVSDLEEQRSCLEEENHAMFGKTVYHSNMSLVFNDVVSKNLVQLADLSEKLNKLDRNNVDLDEKARGLEQKLEGLRTENVHLKEVLVKSDNDMHMAKSNNDQLQNEIAYAKDLLAQKENDIDRSDGQVDAFFSELQISNVRETLLEGKIGEIVRACVSLEDERNSKGVEIELLKQRLGTLGDENEELQTQLASYTSAVTSLNSCIASLERNTMLGERPKLETKEPEDAHEELSKSDEVQTATPAPDGVSELRDAQRRLEAVEIVVTEKVKAAMLENFVSGTKLDAAMREIEELKAGSVSSWESGQTSNHHAAAATDGASKSLRVRTRRSKTQEISELVDNEVLTKDIVLDQMSSDFSHLGRSKRAAAAGDGRLLELWETADRGGSIDLTVGRSHKSKNPSVESLIEKELGVDSLEVSRRISGPGPRQEGSRRRALERLDSDAQKLSNLQITVQDLKRKVETTEKSRKGKGADYAPVKGQLDEAEDAIAKLFDANRRLVKSFDDGGGGGSQPPVGIPAAAALEESGSVRRRRVSEQARRGSEKIGRLQLEVQRLQFLLLKIDGDEKESRARTRVPDHKSRVLLRDYLYGGTVRPRKYKKASFCSCVQPTTRGD